MFLNCFLKYCLINKLIKIHANYINNFKFEELTFNFLSILLSKADTKNNELFIKNESC